MKIADEVIPLAAAKLAKKNINIVMHKDLEARKSTHVHCGYYDSLYDYDVVSKANSDDRSGRANEEISELSTSNDGSINICSEYTDKSTDKSVSLMQFLHTKFNKELQRKIQCKSKEDVSITLSMSTQYNKVKSYAEEVCKTSSADQINKYIQIFSNDKTNMK